jgi:hypothetical protein
MNPKRPDISPGLVDLLDQHQHPQEGETYQCLRNSKIAAIGHTSTSRTTRLEEDFDPLLTNTTEKVQNSPQPECRLPLLASSIGDRNVESSIELYNGMDGRSHVRPPSRCRS